jgi:pimeloyl-ACP methyl ester carboxylesterase
MGDGNYDLATLADDLKAAVEYEQGVREAADAAGGVARPKPVLVGHSLGGMVILQLCRQDSEFVRANVAGIVLAHTTYTNPLRTMSMSKLWTALQKPVIEPLCYITIVLSPLLWVLSLFSYLNGSAHRSNHRSGFSGRESREQLGFASRYALKLSPAVVARTSLASFRFDASDSLSTVPVPTLVVGGESDTTTLYDASQRLNAVIPSSRLFALPRAKHQGPVEFDAIFASELTHFVTRAQEEGSSSPSNGPGVNRFERNALPGRESEREHRGVDGKTAPERTESSTRINERLRP